MWISTKKGNINYQTLIHCIKVSVDYGQTCKNCVVVLWFVHFYHGLVQHEKFEDTKGVIRSCKSMKDRQHNRRKKKDKQRLKKKTKDRSTQTPLKTGVNSYNPEGSAVSAPYVTSVFNICNTLNYKISKFLFTEK